MYNFYPIYLNLRNKKCLVVGGGKVAERKVRSLLECGARVYVVSPEVTPALEQLAWEGAITFVRRTYTTTDLEGSFLVIGATDDEKTNQRIADDCFERNMLVNIVDDPPKCNFIVPAVVRQGALSISISTDGNSPVLARKIKEKLKQEYGPEYAKFLEIMGDLRRKIISSVPDESVRRQMFEDLVNSDIINLIKEGNEEKIKERINHVLNRGRTQP
ncbi:precorrin-2 dehydrogenase/sirohydrochlorin ferrochelatase family protein [Thermincola potens]|uniref:precorrin-2 dehydrogenase n=1 Tax=Thermincola potens (strain JR) TaxID=635013 RepID=D5XEC6_THEPJ|nr:bifunctional precorrin-2 dehydrogenase/sirohydrochlorin ferrochelatase [Thermincola potens]ADG81997.1 siroheme synthase [Thermincola potens JR]